MMSRFPRLRALLGRDRRANRPARRRHHSVTPLEALEGRALMAGADLKVALRVGSETLEYDIVQQYSAGAIGSAGWDTVDLGGRGAKFSYLETHQLPVLPKDAGKSLNLRVSETPGNGINSVAYPGFAAFLKGSPLKNATGAEFRWGQEIQGLKLTPDAPVQITLIPYNAAKNEYLPTKAYAVWISAQTFNQDPGNTVIQSDLGWGSKDQAFHDHGLVRPQWRFSEASNTLKFLGSLDRYNPGGDRYGKDLSITLGNLVTLDVPLTNSYVTITLPRLTDAQRAVVQKLDGKSDLAALSAGELSALRGIKIVESDNYFHVVKPKLASKVHIDGYGRINGYSTYNNRSAPALDLNDFSRLAKPASLLDEITAGQYMVRSGLIEIHSTRAITVEGISVAYGPVRHQEFIQLGSDEPVRLFDLKTPGTFHGAADGPGILTPNATASYLYLQHSDDAIKVFADNQHFRDITLIQGNAGAAIDLGAYGYNRPIGARGASVQGVYLHRILQQGPGYDGLGGVITTRNKAAGVEIANVSISGVFIADLGASGPNQYFRKTAIGFLPGGLFAGGTRQSTTIRNLTIHPFSGLKPQDAQSYSFRGPTSFAPYYERANGRLKYNLGRQQGSAFPGNADFPRNPVGTQFGQFQNVVDNS